MTVAYLRFQRNAAIEPGTASDKLWLELWVGTVATTIWDKNYQNGPGVGWKQVELPISDVATGPFKLRFEFDSVDKKENKKEAKKTKDQTPSWEEKKTP